MEKGKIRKIDLGDELNQAQDSFIQSAEENTERHINDYINLPESLNGRNICSDLFKETFPEYAQSTENRTKYNRAVHNSAAVLSNEMFIRKISDSKIKKSIFLSGVPGAGKSFFIQSLALEGTLTDDTIVFEGDITSPSIFEKMELARQNGKNIMIIIVNPTPRLAQTNAINRRFEMGRGASSETIARIFSRIPKAIDEIEKRFPEARLGIFDKKSNTDVDYYIGFEHKRILEHGSYDDILEDLLRLRIEILESLKDKITNEARKDDEVKWTKQKKL